jgi:hypothetical protein
MSDNKKKILFQKVSGSTFQRLVDASQVRQVFHDKRIPIIRRYDGHWATEKIAITVAHGRRGVAYRRGELARPKEYAYNASNSAKRNPKAPRGRWDSKSNSVKRRGKGRKAPRTEQQEHDISTAPPVPLDRGAVDDHAADVHSPSQIASFELQDPSSSPAVNPSGRQNSATSPPADASF